MLDLHRLCRDMSDPKSPLRREAEDCIGGAAACLDRPSPRTAALLAHWRADFRVIYGEVSSPPTSGWTPRPCCAPTAWIRGRRRTGRSGCRTWSSLSRPATAS